MAEDKKMRELILKPLKAIVHGREFMENPETAPVIVNRMAEETSFPRGV